jgi:hypothetical protein
VGLLATGGSGFIAGNFTSALVIANFAPANNPGLCVLTSDMGIMQSDGVRWNVVGTPPIPPGATMCGYGKNLYTCFPTLADIGNWNGSGNGNGEFRLYSGYAPYGTIPNASAYTTASNGQLQLAYQGSGNPGNGILTIWPYATGKIYANYGILASFEAARGFHWEYAATMSTNATDSQNAGFLEPQEHNNEQDDSNPAFVVKWEQWHEFDNNESGHGTDWSGAYRGAYLQWSGRYNWSQTFTGTPTSTGATLTTAWGGETGSFTITLSTGQQIAGNFTHGSTAVTWSSTTITGSPTTSFTTGYKTWLNNSNIDTTAVDMTIEHIFGATYDPVGQTYTSWLDGVMTNQVSTYNAASSNTFRDSLHYGPIFSTESHGSPYTASTMQIRYFAAWTP